MLPAAEFKLYAGILFLPPESPSSKTQLDKKLDKSLKLKGR